MRLVNNDVKNCHPLINAMHLQETRSLQVELQQNKLFLFLHFIYLCFYTNELLNRGGQWLQKYSFKGGIDLLNVLYLNLNEMSLAGVSVIFVTVCVTVHMTE